jgi:hypothetical protein
VALLISLFELLYLIAREVKDRPVPPTDPASTPKTLGDLFNLVEAATADEDAKVAVAAAADKAAMDAKATTVEVKSTMKARLKRPFFVQKPDGAIAIVTPDTSEVGFHVFFPDPADTPLDEAAPPAPAPAPEPAPGPAPVIPGPEAAPA